VNKRENHPFFTSEHLLVGGLQDVGQADVATGRCGFSLPS
jgi:hypothetical protein